MIKYRYKKNPLVIVGIKHFRYPKSKKKWLKLLHKRLDTL